MMYSDVTNRSNPLSPFMYALKAPESRWQYPCRFKVFLDFLNLQCTIEEQAMEFLIKARQNPHWAQDNLNCSWPYKTKEIGA
jgi:hypothetical protein